MNKETWKAVDSLFDEYLDSSPEDQETFLSRRCEEGPIRTELAKLIASLESSSVFIEDSKFPPVSDLLSPSENGANSLEGRKIGRYQLGRLLGTGGNGSVYLAVRTDDYTKEVAIKLIPAFSNTGPMAENFRRERQILARLEHENIARIVDGGTTEDGTPFLVMEYIEGLPLDDFCENTSMTTDERLKLFLKVCDAVSFAHQNLIIHRDLKPSNILVKSGGKVKLLDFGIAKLLETEELSDIKQQTLAGRAFTPDYASPEQIEGAVITTASDVYSLGVILYELIAGTRPFNFSGKPIAEIRAAFAKSEAVAPGRLKTNKPIRSSNELDSIILKALAVSVRERYKTVQEFSDDIQNHLNDLPVSARPGTQFYRLGKYVRRNRIPLAATIALVGLSLGWFVTAFLQSNRAAADARENRRAAYAAEMILASREFENTNLNRVNELVRKYEPDADEEDVRGIEWYFLRKRLNPSGKTNSFLHSDEVWSTEFSPDGKLLATICNDNITRIWDVQSGSVIAQTAPQKGAWKGSFFPDGKQIAVASSSNSEPLIKIFDTQTGAETAVINGHAKRVRAIDVSPTGELIASGSLDGTVKIWDSKTHQLVRTIEIPGRKNDFEVNDVLFNRDGTKLVITGFEILAVVDTRSWTIRKAEVGNLRTDKRLDFFSWKVALSTNATILAAANFSGEIILFDFATLKPTRILSPHRANVKSLVFQRDANILVTASWDRTVRFIDVGTGQTVRELRGHFAGVHEVDFSPDGSTMVTASADFSVNLWSTAEVSRSNSIFGDGALFGMTENGSTAVFVKALPAQVTAWNLSGRNLNWSKSLSDASRFSAAVSDAARQVAVSERDGAVSLLSLDNGTLEKKLEFSKNTSYSLVFSPDGRRLFTGQADGTLNAIDIESGNLLKSERVHNELIRNIAISKDGSLIATGSNDKTVKLLKADTLEVIASFEGGLKPMYMVAFSDDGQLLASAGADDTVRIRRVRDGKLLQELTGMSAGVFAVAFSPDGKRIATASDIATVRLWDTESGRQVFATTIGESQITSVRFSTNGKSLFAINKDGLVTFLES